VVQTRVIEPSSDLIGLELEDRQNDGFSPRPRLLLPSAGKAGYGAILLKNSIEAPCEFSVATSSQNSASYAIEFARAVLTVRELPYRPAALFLPHQRPTR
jgi:hypothetical protein